MKKLLYIFLVSGFSLTIISCAEKEESTTTTTDTTTTTSSDDSSSTVVTMASLTIGSQTYTNAFQSVTDGCRDTELTDHSSGDKIYYLTTLVYYDNNTLAESAPLYTDSSCTNKYTETSVLTSDGTFVNPYPLNVVGDNITVVQLSNYFDNGNAMPVFDNDSNAVDNGVCTVSLLIATMFQDRVHSLWWGKSILNLIMSYMRNLEDGMLVLLLDQIIVLHLTILLVYKMM